MNSYIRTTTGFSFVIDNKAYVVESTHRNFDLIKQAVRDGEWSLIPGMINQGERIATYFATADSHIVGKLKLDLNNNEVTYMDRVLPGVLVTHILDMYNDNFDLVPMAKFLKRLYNNPSAKAVEQLYGWMEANGITIDEEGYLVAYKRVQDNYTSFYDSVTLNSVGTQVQMPRNAVDDRSERTCSNGLHFCSQSYLPAYCSGAGRVLILRIDPADVVSIPTDYKFAKGRACSYYVVSELTGDTRTRVEVEDVLPQPVLMDSADVNQPTDYVAGYQAGYKDGRGKKAQYASFDLNHDSDGQYAIGYDAGRVDGRNKKPKLY